MDKQLEQIIEAKVKELSKQSTAPDKETPDWMESDIRRGILAGIEIAGATSSSTVKNLEERLAVATELLDDIFHERFPSSEISRRIIAFKKNNL